MKTFQQFIHEDISSELDRLLKSIKLDTKVTKSGKKTRIEISAKGTYDGDEAVVISPSGNGFEVDYEYKQAGKWTNAISRDFADFYGLSKDVVSTLRQRTNNWGKGPRASSGINKKRIKSK